MSTLAHIENNSDNADTDIYDSGNDFVKLCDNIWLIVLTFPLKLTILWFNDVYTKHKTL